jgi:hypothetical protein
VQIKFQDADTNTSYVTKDLGISVDGANAAWNYGYRALNIENLWITDTAAADSLATALYTDLSSVKNEIAFTTSFVPHLYVLDGFNFYYDKTEANVSSKWDINNWDTELTWDKIGGDSLIFNGDNFKLVSTEINLDKFECKFIGRE